MASVSRRLAGVALIAAIGTGCSHKPPDDKDYAATIAADRASKDESFLKDDTPVPKNLKAELLPLAYFPIDPDYKVAAVLKPTQDPTIILMPYSTGTEREVRRVGTLEFSLKGQPLTLAAFVEVAAPDIDHPFVPFADLTTGTETYAAGRMLDLDRNGTDIYAVDFNRAYQPYCYYNASYDCPYPPSENRLKVPIRAGERIKVKRQK